MCNGYSARRAKGPRLLSHHMLERKAIMGLAVNDAAQNPVSPQYSTMPTLPGKPARLLSVAVKAAAL